MDSLKLMEPRRGTREEKNLMQILVFPESWRPCLVLVGENAM